MFKYILISLIWINATSYAASYYQCMDANGHKSFQQTPCGDNQEQQIQAVTSELQT